MTDIRDVLVNEVKRFQKWASGQKDHYSQVQWFTTLELEETTVTGDTIAFVWRDPADGSRHGWRWQIAPDRLYLLEVHLEEDLVQTERLTEPDENGVRWWGVNLYT